MDLRKLLYRVEIAPVGSPELDSEFESTFRSVTPHVTRSIDAAARLIETELPGGGTAGIAHLGMARLSMSLAPAKFE